MNIDAAAAFERECLDLGAASAAARMRLDKRGPEAYRRAHEAYRGPREVPQYYARKWLSLRLSAVKRGMVVDPTVTPAFLERVTNGCCPVTLQPFSTEGKAPTNPSVDRLVNQVTYRAGNICVLSLPANRAKGERSFEEVAQLAQAGEPHAGLEPLEWMRLASLMYGAWARAYRQADPYLLPLAAIPGPGMFMSTSQVVQLLLTRQFASDSGGSAATERWLGLTEECGCPASVFLDLHERLTAALAEEAHPGNAWLHGDVFETFVAWYTASSATINPVVEELLQKHQARAGGRVATLEWPTESRYMR
jgi:hypothetical protein